jgi:hypothetical protein
VLLQGRNQPKEHPTQLKTFTGTVNKILKKEFSFILRHVLTLLNPIGQKRGFTAPWLA